MRTAKSAVILATARQAFPFSSFSLVHTYAKAVIATVNKKKATATLAWSLVCWLVCSVKNLCASSTSAFWKGCYGQLALNIHAIYENCIFMVIASMATKRRLSAMSLEIGDSVDPADELMFLCLGGGNEVGRSCHIIQYKGKTVMVYSTLGTVSKYRLHS